MESLDDFCARTKSSSTAKQISNKERAHRIKPPATHKREKKFFYVWLYYVFFKLHDLSSIVSCVPIEILLKKVLVYGTYTMASAANARWLCCASNCELTGQESREDNSIHSATSLFTVLSLNHFSKRIKSSRLQLKFGGNIETNNRVINVVTYPNGYKRRLAIYEIIQLITDHTPKNIFHDRLIFIIEL